MNNKIAIITGAAGFVGYHLTRQLSDKGFQVYALVRPGSEHNHRINCLPNVCCIETDILCDSIGCDIDSAWRMLSGCDYFFHLIWKPADRYDYPGQMDSAYLTLKMLEKAAGLGCHRFIGIGSQAEYGVSANLISEDETFPHPFCGYGAAKVAACELTRRRAQELNIEWVWGRIFSVYGKYEPQNRLIPHLIDSFLKNEDVKLSSCRQQWDFLFGSDAGEALLAMAQLGRDGEIYNIADGRYHMLREYVEIIRDLCDSKSKIIYGADPEPFVSLQPSMKKLKGDTGWEPHMSFEDGIRYLIKEHNYS